MEKIQWKVQQVIDAHGHFRGLEPLPHYYGLLDLVGHTKVNVMGGTIRGGPPMDRKREFPRRFYCFGCLEHDPAKVEAGDGAYLVGQVEQLLALGYDGLKMMEGKPAYRKVSSQVSTGWMPLALDHRYFHPLWDRLETLDVPITMHLADPLDWWTAPDGVYRQGYEPQEEFFRQAIAVLERRPRLRITFAHFMFMGPQLDRLGSLFARFPQMRVDLAMGHEFLYYLSDDPQKARAFFITWPARAGTARTSPTATRGAWRGPRPRRCGYCWRPTGRS